MMIIPYLHQSNLLFEQQRERMREHHERIERESQHKIEAYKLGYTVGMADGIKAAVNYMKKQIEEAKQKVK